MTTKKATTTLRRCAGSTRFGIEPHEAPVSEFTKQPSRKDGLAVMCKPHWSAYVKGLAADRKAKAAGGQTTAEPSARPAKTVEKPTQATTKRERRRTPMASKPESPRQRKARETLAAVETLPGPEYVKAVGSDEVQAALEVMNGHRTVEPDDGQVLVAGVLYDSETLEEADAA